MTTLIHSWYDSDCCSDKDCSRAPMAIVEMHDGYHLADGRTVPYRDPRVRQSADSDFHVCQFPDGRIICLYVPGRGI